MRITILGMGNMGRAFAARALDKGHEVTVWNRSPGRAGDLGSGHIYCGPLGSGNTVKIVVNLLLVAGVSAVAEAVATARSHGVPDELLKAILPDLPVVAPATRARLDSVMDPGHPGSFAPALARKDVRLAIGLAEEAGLAVRIGPATEALLSSVVDRGGDWEDFSAVIEALS